MKTTGRLIVSIEGKQLSDADRTVLSHPLVAGVILFNRNYESDDQLLLLTTEIRTFNLTIFADQEGGKVQRIAKEARPLPSLKSIGLKYVENKDDGLKMAYRTGYSMTEDMKRFGIISLSPVMDLDAGNKVISGLDRAFHSDSEVCIQLLSSYVQGMNDAGMQATGKHFPGHGQDNGDSHLQAVQDDRTLEEIEQQDLLPFRALIAEDRLGAIMPAHIVFSQVDPDHTAGASKIWLQKLLREKYQFKGIILSDCLSMVGSFGATLIDKTKAALEYGDIAIIANKPPAELIAILEQLPLEEYALSPLGQERLSKWISPPSKKSPRIRL